MSDYKGVMEGEGIIGFRPISILTTELLSCLAIAMANMTTKQLGLYHYPARNLGKPGVDQVMIRMINDVKPDFISLTAGGFAAGEQDILKVIEFLKKNSGKAITRDEKLTNGVEFGWRDSGKNPYLERNYFHYDEKPHGFVRLECNDVFVTATIGNSLYLRGRF